MNEHQISANALSAAQGEPTFHERLVEGAITYAKHLQKQLSLEESNAWHKSVGLPPQHHPTFVGGNDFKEFYNHTEREVARKHASGGLLLKGRLVEESLKRLESMRRGSGRPGETAHAALAFSEVSTKFAGNGKRIVRGFASTADVDLCGDIVVPSGMETPRLPLSLLWQHDAGSPIGTIDRADVKGSGIWIEASLVEGIQRADEAWKLIEARACDAFSIGARVFDSEPIATGGRRWTRWALMEVSIVSCPANQSARIARSAGGRPITPVGNKRADGSYALRAQSGGYRLRAAPTRGSR